MGRRASDPAGKWCRGALRWCCGAACAVWALAQGNAATLSEKARESGCTGKPVAISNALYKCVTSSGAESFFNVPPSDGGPIVRPRVAERNDNKQAPTPAPAGFPRVDPETQKGRDDLRRKVLAEELTAFGNGAPPPLAEEQADAEKYRQRISRLRQAVQLHERNIEALKKELGNTR
jgi:hypothetical protein